MWIWRVVLNPESFWQDNCLMGIQCIAAISCGLGARVVIAMLKHATYPAKTYHASCYPRSGFSTNRLIAHSDIAMVNDYFAQSTSHWQDRLARSVEDGEVSRKALSSGPETALWEM
jgi:hypothetical protein